MKTTVIGTVTRRAETLGSVGTQWRYGPGRRHHPIGGSTHAPEIHRKTDFRRLKTASFAAQKQKSPVVPGLHVLFLSRGIQTPPSEPVANVFRWPAARQVLISHHHSSVWQWHQGQRQPTSGALTQKSEGLPDPMLAGSPRGDSWNLFCPRVAKWMWLQ